MKEFAGTTDNSEKRQVSAKTHASTQGTHGKQIRKSLMVASDSQHTSPHHQITSCVASNNYRISTYGLLTLNLDFGLRLAFILR